MILPVVSIATRPSPSRVCDVSRSNQFSMHVSRSLLLKSKRPALIVRSLDGEDYEQRYSEAEQALLDAIDENYEEEDPSIRLYLDSANEKEWAKWMETGIFYGFTTNPSILRRDGVSCTIPAMRQLARHAFELEANELQLQAWGTTMPELYSCALDLAELDERIIVKLPMTIDGLKTARRLVDDDISFTMTAVYSTHQVVTALAAGAYYVAPYLGRMNDAGKNGIEEISKMQSILDITSSYSGESRLLVASIRSADEIALLAAEGCNTFTISPEVAEQLVSDPLTLAAAEVFQEHADEMGAAKDH